jgi:hypothetical protein
MPTAVATLSAWLSGCSLRPRRAQVDDDEACDYVRLWDADLDGREPE